MMTVLVPGLTIQQDTLPVPSVQLSSNVKTLGSTSANTTLNITWTPKTTMDPSGKGQIQIGVPLWYNISGTGQSMYSTSAVNQCTSTCMRITSSSLQNQAINIFYDMMQPQCIAQYPITILCSQFFTPITPDLWPGFSLTTFDSQITSRIIEQTKDTLSFDATQYGPMLIPPSNFVVDPANTMIASFSTWTISLAVNIPLQTQCWIQIYLPPDLTYQTQSLQASGIFIRPDQSTDLTNADLNIIFRNQSIPKSSVTFDGCHSQPALGKTPFGRLDISKIETQSQIKDSGTFQLSIYKDKALTKLIAVLAEGVSVSGQSLQPGLITNASMIPSDYRVQHFTQITVTFTISHTLYENATIVFRMPSGLTTPSAGSKIKIAAQLSNQQQATMYPGGIIQIDNFVTQGQQIQANTTISVICYGIQNQNSVRDAGSYQITTMNMVQGQMYVVDQSTIITSYFATTGSVNAVGNVVVSNPTNFARANIYSLTFTLQDDLPKAGYIQVQFPSQISLASSSTQSSGSCRIYTCTFANSTTVTILMQQGLQAGQELTLQIGGVINPRSLQPSGPIIITTLDTDAESQIDSGYNQSAVMQIPGSIQTFAVQQSSFVNGATNTYQFSVQAQIPIQPGDKFQFTLPSEVTINQANCSVTQNLLNIKCSNMGQVVTVSFDEFNSSTGAFSWTIAGVSNPPSTKTSSVFSNVLFIDSKGFVIQSLSSSQVTVTNKYPAQLTQYSIKQGSLDVNQKTTYSISFTPVNQLPSTGSIQLAYPQQITMVDGSNTKCSVTTNMGQSPCTVDSTAKTITISGILQQSYSEQITITLQNVQNAATNRPGNGFVIQTYAEAAQIYIQDKLNDYILTPLFTCAYPCQTCQFNNPAICTSCWTNYDDPQYLMSYPDGSASCKSFCDFGFTTNGSPNKMCSQCDQSCKTCADNYQIGDVQQCTECSLAYPLQLSKTQKCLSECQLGMYQSTNTSCSLCRAPCQGCSGTESNCTSCVAGSKLANLFQNQCISSCPPGYTSINNVCQRCSSPCATCSNSQTSCISCDGTLSRKFNYFNSCVKDCPNGSVANPDTLNCFACQADCEVCDLLNQTNCLRCKQPNVAFNGECIAQCPNDWHVTDTGGACRPWQLSDIGIIYFPFLIAALIGSIICLFGMMQRRAHILNGKMTMYSPQNTLTCIVVVIGCCQFYATICQWILSKVYGTTTFCILAVLVTVAAIVVNIAFHRTFIVNFDSQTVPTEIERRVRLGKMSKQESLKFKCPQDGKFDSYKRLHKCTTYTIYLFQCCVNYKFNKLFYSFLFNRGQFQACFTKAKYYRKLQTQYMIVYLICIDLALICIDITALTQIEPGNQLYITIIETLVLSILSILLGSLELWLLKRTLSYTEEARDKSRLKLGSGIGSDSDDKDLNKKYDKKKMTERRFMMASLLRQVKNNKKLFLNNKLDELIHAFGDRKCSSMADLRTGWSLEQDPQERITWPVSPQLREDYSEMGFDLQSFGGKSKLKTTEDSTQVDLQLFQEALNRKQKGLFYQSIESDAEENRLKRVNRRRGRKNKFHAQIDKEDNQDLEFVEASDYDERLQIIKEHEIEEEEIRKIQSSTKKQSDGFKKVKEPYLSESEIKEREAKQLLQKIQKDSQNEQFKRDQETTKKNQEAARLEKQRKDAEKAELDRKLKESKKQELERAKQQRLLDEQIQAPADAEKRTFNENDILGDFERDANGNVIRTGDLDRLGRLTNAKGYLIDPATGSLIETQTSKWMFLSQNLGSTGELPAPFTVEKYNFNPHQLMGDFDFKNKKPSVLQTSKGNFSDKKGRVVNKLGWLVKDKHLVNFQGHKKFDFCQLTKDGDLPKLYNFTAKEFDIKSVMGQFDKDSFGKIMPQNTSKGLVDVLGRLVNDKGYLIDKKGNIVDTKGKVIWDKKHLKNGEFMKIFPFTKFDLSTIKAAYDFDQAGQPILQNLNGKFYDDQDRPCNHKGYLIDDLGNIIDQRGYKMFDSDVLTKGEIPLVFRTNLQPPKSGSSVSRLLNELDNKREGETSMDSQMDDTPANYNLQNQRLDVNSISELGSEQSKQKRKKKKFMNVMVLQPTERDKSLAGAYGGQAVGSIKRPGVKYDKERLKNAIQFRVSSENGAKVRAHLANLVKSGSRIDVQSIGNRSVLNESMSQGSRVRSQRGSNRSERPTYEERQRKLNKQHQDELFQPNLSSFLDDSEWDVSVQGQARLHKQEKEFLSVMKQNSKNRDSPALNKKSPREPSVLGPDRETIMNFTDNPQIIHRGEILPFVTKVTRK